jgi:hypothetical protein
VDRVFSTLVAIVEIAETIPSLVDAGIAVPADLLKRAFSGTLDWMIPFTRFALRSTYIRQEVVEAHRY